MVIKKTLAGVLPANNNKKKGRKKKMKIIDKIDEENLLLEVLKKEAFKILKENNITFENTKGLDNTYDDCIHDNLFEIVKRFKYIRKNLLEIQIYANTYEIQLHESNQACDLIKEISKLIFDFEKIVSNIFFSNRMNK